MRVNTLSPEKEKILKEFESKGYVLYSKDLLYILRTRYHEYYRIFKPVHRGRKKKDYPRFGSYEIFGKSKFVYYYDIRKKKEFAEFLVTMFYENNPDADGNIRSVFTRILHNHGICWDGCFCGEIRTKKDKEKEMDSIIDMFKMEPNQLYNAWKENKLKGYFVTKFGCLYELYKEKYGEEYTGKKEILKNDL